MPLDDLIAQRDAPLATRLRGVRTSQCSTLSSTNGVQLAMLGGHAGDSDG